MTIKDYTAQCPNHFNGRKGYKPDMIVLHNTGGTNISSAHYWLLDKTSQTASQFVVGLDGEVRQYVNIADGAWCNGTSNDVKNNAYYGKATNSIVRGRAYNANLYTVSIEFVGNVSDALTAAQLDTAVELIALIKKQVRQIYGTDIIIDRNHVVGHYEIAPKTRGLCGKGIQYAQIIAKVKAAEIQPDTAPIAPAPSTPVPNPVTSDKPIPIYKTKNFKNPAIKSKPWDFKQKD